MYKYRINHFLSCLPIQTSIEKFRVNLKAKYDINPEVFYADRFIKLRAHSTIPMERLKMYAKEFDIPVEELFAKQETTSS